MKEIMDQNYNAGQLRRKAELRRLEREYKKDLVLTLLIGTFIIIITIIQLGG